MTAILDPTATATDLAGTGVGAGAGVGPAGATADLAGMVAGEVGGVAVDDPTAPRPAGPSDGADDPEVRLLSALLWTNQPAGGDVAHILDWLHPLDFASPFLGAVFAAMVDHATAGGVLNPVELAGHITAAEAEADPTRRVVWPDGRPVEELLADLAAADGIPAQALWWADEVLGRSYRRQFQAMATFLAQAGREVGEDELWQIMADAAARQRRAKARRDGFLGSIPAQDPTRDRREADKAAHVELVELFTAIDRVRTTNSSTTGTAD